MINLVLLLGFIARTVKSYCLAGSSKNCACITCPPFALWRGRRVMLFISVLRYLCLAVTTTL